MTRHFKPAFLPNGNVAGSPGTENQSVAQIQHRKGKNVCPNVARTVSKPTLYPGRKPRKGKQGKERKRREIQPQGNSKQREANTRNFTHKASTIKATKSDKKPPRSRIPIQTPEQSYKMNRSSIKQLRPKKDRTQSKCPLAKRTICSLCARRRESPKPRSGRKLS